MNLLQLKNGAKGYGARMLFTDASFAVNADEKVGVIGPNGAGKSTLFRILIGEESLDTGDLTRASGLQVGYLAQEDVWKDDDTIGSYLAKQDRTPEWDLRQMAPAFGLTDNDFSRAMKSLSGGYRMRAKLLRLVAMKPDLMLLDEPTNYLDLETLVVLERFLQETKLAFMLISHDREFLRRTTDHILEIEAGEMTKYSGNIDDYFEQKEMLRMQLEKAALSAANKRKEILDFAARFGAKATKARQVQSRLKSLDRMEIIEVKALPTSARIRLPEPSRTGKTVIKVDGADLGYGEKKVITGVNLELGKGDHLGVVGVNGVGKSTLLKSLAGELALLKGTRELGLGAEVAYFAQHVAERLNPTDTVIEAMGQFATADVKRQEILDLAGSLLFSGDDVQKRIAVLSGGEKSRVALGQVLLKKASCLLLDEPTNHLDFTTVEALTQAIGNYSGTVVIVSHDRGFVRRTATKILELRDGRAEFYPGSYDEYVWSVQKGALAEAREAQGAAASAPMSSRLSVAESVLPPETKFNYKERKKQLEKAQRGHEKELATLDASIEKHKAKVLEINERLLAVSGAEAAAVARDLAAAQGEIDALEARYLETLEAHEDTSRELESMENPRTD
jgi:ATP-binding cassette subfamily F protein 3